MDLFLSLGGILFPSLYLLLRSSLAVIRTCRYFSANFADSLSRRFLVLRWMRDAFLNSIPNIPRRLGRARDDSSRGECSRRVVPVKTRSRPRRAHAPIE